MSEIRNYQRGDIFLATLEPRIGSEQGGTRPVIVLQNNIGNYYSPTSVSYTHLTLPTTTRV